jgi:hypothetical protein
MVATLVYAVEHPATGIRIIEVPQIRESLREINRIVPEPAS